MIARWVDLAFSLCSLGLLAYVVISWLGVRELGKAHSLLARCYEPALARIRLSMKPVRFGTVAVDLSPALLLVGLAVLKTVVLHLLPRGV